MAIPLWVLSPEDHCLLSRKICSKSTWIDRVDVTIVTYFVLCRYPLISVYFLSCDIDERRFLFLDFSEMYAYSLIPLIRLETFFLSPSVLLM